MSVLIWNIRGIGNKASLEYLKAMIRQHKPIIVGILEHKQHPSRIEEYAKKLGFTGYLHGPPTNKYIWIFWNSAVDIQDMKISQQTITITAQLQSNQDPSFFLTRRTGEENGLLLC